MKQRPLKSRFSTMTTMGFAVLLAACNPVDFRSAKSPTETQSPESPALPLAEEGSTSSPPAVPVAVSERPQVPSVDLARTSETPVVAFPLPASDVSPAGATPPPRSTAEVPPTTVPPLTRPPLSNPPMQVAKLWPPADARSPEKPLRTTPVEDPRKMPETVVKTPVQFTERPATERPALDKPRLTNGACTAGTQLLSCMRCPSPTTTETEPQLSEKGRALLEIMTRACRVTNASDPENYRAPVRIELLRRMNRLSPALYPDTKMTDDQHSTIISLLSGTDLTNRMFSGIFYSGVTTPTTAFETFFGLSTIEARYTLCYAKDSEGTVDGLGLTFTPSNSTPLTSKVYLHCNYREGSDQCRETDEYLTANVYRTQLRRAMTESVTNPFVRAQTTRGQTCEWEKLEGKIDDAAVARVNAWLASGFTIGLDIPSRGMCMQLKKPLGNVAGIAVDTPITLAAYRCR